MCGRGVSSRFLLMPPLGWEPQSFLRLQGCNLEASTLHFQPPAQEGTVGAGGGGWGQCWLQRESQESVLFIPLCWQLVRGDASPVKHCSTRR